ncbi:MAG: cell division initiation protein [Bacillota bacterium]|jgi:cell division initiation protein|nr:cell division initiation protein [Bacillota bacterium]MDK2881984.1 cell division initiation protein [Bacillota bacterium]MDK2960062.1 cell division initiation protein [Bacillota bacterium]
MLTPLDIQKKEFHRRLRGYSEVEVDEFLDQVLEDYELLYRQNASLKDEVERLKAEVERFTGLEETLKNTLVLAQKAADEIRSNAQKEAELILKEAEARARALEEEGRRRLELLEEEFRALEGKIASYKAQTRALLLGAAALLDPKAEDGDEEEAGSANGKAARSGEKGL